MSVPNSRGRAACLRQGVFVGDRGFGESGIGDPVLHRRGGFFRGLGPFYRLTALIPRPSGATNSGTRVASSSRDCASESYSAKRGRRCRRQGERMARKESGRRMRDGVCRARTTPSVAALVGMARRSACSSSPTYRSGARHEHRDSRRTAHARPRLWTMRRAIRRIRVLRRGRRRSARHQGLARGGGDRANR